MQRNFQIEYAPRTAFEAVCGNTASANHMLWPFLHAWPSFLSCLSLTPRISCHQMLPATLHMQPNPRANFEFVFCVRSSFGTSRSMLCHVCTVSVCFICSPSASLLSHHNCTPCDIQSLSSTDSFWSCLRQCTFAKHRFWNTCHTRIVSEIMVRMSFIFNIVTMPVCCPCSHDLLRDKLAPSENDQGYPKTVFYTNLLIKSLLIIRSFVIGKNNVFMLTCAE